MCGCNGNPRPPARAPKWLQRRAGLEQRMQPTLISGESVVLTTRKHWAAPLADSLWAIGMMLLSLVLGWVQPERTSGLLGFIGRALDLIQIGLFLGGAAWIVYNVVAWRTAEYSVTNRRVLGQDGLV